MKTFTCPFCGAAPGAEHDPQCGLKADPIVDRGPWKVIQLDDGRLAVGSDDFEHDVWLYVSGDFADDQQRLRYAETLVAQLNLARAEQRRFVKDTMIEDAINAEAIPPIGFIPHLFVGRADRYCEFCNTPDRNPIHQIAAPEIPAPVPDWEHPNWAEYHKVHCWRNHVGEEVMAMWETFTPEQKKAIATYAEELASAEHWD